MLLHVKQVLGRDELGAARAILIAPSGWTVA